MRFSILALLSAAVAMARTLDTVCTPSYVRSALPDAGFYVGITIDPSSVTTNVVRNTSYTSNMYPDATISYCNVTYAYTHNGRNDVVLNELWFPAPANFHNRWLSTGGSAYAINSGETSLPGGVLYGAVSGITDGGFGGFDVSVDAVFLLANGTINYDALYMFGYEAHHELTLLGKEITRKFYNVSSSDKIYAYYQGCSEGGREGWSQVQRYDEWDGAVIGAPAFRYGQQQVNHLTSGLIETNLDYFPPSCEFDAIVNATIAVCDYLDGKVDGVVARTDLCKLQLDLQSLVGTPYSCPATAAATLPPLVKRQFPGGGANPAQNGTITEQGIAVAQAILDGLKDNDGRQAYLSYQPSATFADGATTYDATTDSWSISPSFLGTGWVLRFLELIESDTIATFDGIDNDTLVSWMWEGWQRYDDVLQTTWPDLTPFHANGGKVIHFHGESDNSVPTASSVRYYESVRNVMYPDLSLDESTEALNDWYRLFLIPGAGHCASNTLEPNGPFPQTQLAQLIDWVENGIEPVTLNGTVLSGDFEGQQQQICSWPLRPYWPTDSIDPECVFDQKSFDSWQWNLTAWSIPLY